MRLAKVQSLRRDLTVLAQSHESGIERLVGSNVGSRWTVFP